MRVMKLDSLKSTAEFDFIYRNARRFFHKSFVFYALYPQDFSFLSFRAKQILSIIRSRGASMYLGLSISRKIGKAHIRNLCKRRLKAIIRENVLDKNAYQDSIFVIVPREGIITSDLYLIK